MKTVLAMLVALLLLAVVPASTFATDYTQWKAPPGGARIDPTGGRGGGPALMFEQPKEMVTEPWLSPAQPIHGKYVRASAWMKAKDLYYLDFGFFAYAAVEFLDANGKSIKEEPFILSREIMLAEPLLMQRMETHRRLLNFDWRYGERVIPVAAGATQVRLKFALAQRTTGTAWLDGAQLTFLDAPEPAELSTSKSTVLPPIDVRLRNTAAKREKDPLGHLFFPNENADFFVAVPKTADREGNLHVVVTDSEGFTAWEDAQPLSGASDWIKISMPAEIGSKCVGRLLDAQFEFVSANKPTSKTEFTFGWVNEFRRDETRDGPEQRFIGNLRGNWNGAFHSRFWMQRGDALSTNSFHMKNIWIDGTKPPDMSTLTSLYTRPDILHGKFNYSVVGLIAGGQPNLIPEFSYLGHHALPTPEATGTFMRALVRRFPYIKYWKALNEMYRADVPGYREAFVKCQKAFYEAVKAENPDAVVILDNSSVRSEARALYELGLFDYCDAIDPHLYGQVEEIIFGFFKREKEQLESWGVHKRWISLEADPIPGAGATGIDPRWVSEEVTKELAGYYALGGEKMCLLGSGAIADPQDPFAADAHGGPGFTPTINYFSNRRFVDQVGLRPSGGSYILGDTAVRYQQFNGDNDTVAVLWSVKGEHTVSIDSASGLRVVDNVRTDAKLNSPDGHYRVTVGVQPVYVTGSAGMKIALSPAEATTSIDGGGLVVGKPNSITLTVADANAKTATIALPPGVTATQTTVPCQNGKATFDVTIPAGHEGSVVTLSFLYGDAGAQSNLLVHRYDLIRPISAEILSDAAIQDGRPQFVVRVVNTNPVAARGKIIARLPLTDDARPTDVALPFDVAAKSNANVKFVFPAAAMPKQADDQNAWPATAFIYPDGGGEFAVREPVNFANIPKVQPGLRIDGDLSDWPDWSGNAVQSIGSALQYVGASDSSKPSDIQTKLQTAWDRATLYYAVRVRGKDAEQSKGIRVLFNNAQDKRAAGYETRNEERSVTIRPQGDAFAMQAETRSKDGHGVLWKARRVDGGIDYEVAIPLWEASNEVEIDPDRWVRMSVAVLDTDGKSLWQWFGGGKSPNDYATFGAFQLAAYGQNEWGQRYGCPTAGGGRERSGFVGLATLADGRHVRVRVTAPEKSVAEVLSPDGAVLTKFELPVGKGIHTVDVDQNGRLVVGDRVAGVNFYSVDTGQQIPLGPTRGFYPKRHIIEYRSQGVAQDAEGNYFVTLVRKRRAGPGQPCPTVIATGLTKISGLTMFGPDGVEVKSFGQDIVVANAMAPLRVFGGMGERAGAFLYAESVVVDPANNLWATDYDANTLQIFGRRSPGVYGELPIVYTKLPGDLDGAQLRALPDGRVIAWTPKQMRIASLVGGKVDFGDAVPFAKPIVDLKIEKGDALTLDQSGNIAAVKVPAR